MIEKSLPRLFNPCDATARQKHYIAQLCMQLGIREPLEEIPMPQGDAGRLIRTLEARRKTQRR